MALRSLMLTKSINEKRAALAELEAKDFQTREAEIATAIEEAASDEERAAVEESIDAFEADKAETDERKENLRAEIAALEAELADIEAAAPAETGEEKPIEERKDEKHMDIRELRSSERYLNAYATYLKTEDEMECRALLTELAVTDDLENVSGPLPVPTYVENKIRTAWENDGIMSRVRKTYLKGIVKVGFEISATDAAVHAEGGEAPTEEQLVLGIASLLPSSIKKFITISDEALDLNGSSLIDYIFDELTYKIVQFAAYGLVGLIATVDETSTPDMPGQALITADPALGTVAEAIAALSDQATNPVVIINKATWATFKAAQYDGNYNIDPFEGLDVVFCNALPAFADAEEDEVYMIVGDLGYGAQANFPNGDEVKLKFDDLSLAELDLVKIVGRMYVGIGLVAVNAFARVAKAGE